MLTRDDRSALSAGTSAGRSYSCKTLTDWRNVLQVFGVGKEFSGYKNRASDRYADETPADLTGPPKTDYAEKAKATKTIELNLDDYFIQDDDAVSARPVSPPTH